MKFWKRYIKDGKSLLTEIQPSEMDFSRPMVIVLPGSNVIDTNKKSVNGYIKAAETLLLEQGSTKEVPVYCCSYLSNASSIAEQIRSNGGVTVGNYYTEEVSGFVNSVMMPIIGEERRDLEMVKSSLRGLSFLAQSHGTTFIQMIQVALGKKLAANYTEEEVGCIMKEVVVVGVSNISRTDCTGNSFVRILIDGSDDHVSDRVRFKQIPEEHHELTVLPMNNGIRVIADVSNTMTRFRNTEDGIKMEVFIDADKHQLELYSEFGPHQPGHVDITAYALRNAVKRTGTIENPLDLLIPSLPLGKSMYDVPHPNQLYGHTAKIIAAAIERGKDGGHKR